MTMTQPTPVRDDIDLLDGRWYATNPHDAWAWMREHAPVYYDAKNDTWGVSKYNDLLAVEKNAQTFSNAQGIRPHGFPLPMMISMDDPDHLRRRKLVNRGFTPKQVRNKEQVIREICDQLIDKVCEKGECDFVWDIAAPLPLLLIAEMLGFPPETYDDLLRWSDDMIKGTTATDPEALENAHRAGQEYRALMESVIADRRSKPPTDDLISVLCEAEIDGDRLDDNSIVEETLLILIGGDETTRHVITGGTIALMAFPDQRQRLIDDRELLPNAVEEMLRWVSPIKNMNRTVTRETQLGGVTLPEGAQVLLFFPSANRDEEIFPNANTFDVARFHNQHVAFGFGTHFCLGASLARLELNVMFDRLLDRMPDVELATDDPIHYRASNFIVGPEAMPVRFTPSAPLR